MWVLSGLLLSLAVLSPSDARVTPELLEVIAEAVSMDCIDIFIEDKVEENDSDHDKWMAIVNGKVAMLSWTFSARKEWRIKTGV